MFRRLYTPLLSFTSMIILSFRRLLFLYLVLFFHYKTSTCLCTFVPSLISISIYIENLYSSHFNILLKSTRSSNQLDIDDTSRPRPLPIGTAVSLDTMADPIPIPGPPGLPLIGNMNDIDQKEGITSLCRLADTYGKYAPSSLN